MNKNVRFCQAEESPKDWSWSGHSSFSSLEDSTLDFQERIMLPPKIPVRKASREPTDFILDDETLTSHNEEEEEEDSLNDTAIPMMIPSILRRKSRYGKCPDAVSRDIRHKAVSSSKDSIHTLPTPTKKNTCPHKQTTSTSTTRNRNSRRNIRDMRSSSDDSMQWIRKETTVNRKQEMELHWQRVPPGQSAKQQDGAVCQICEATTTETRDNE